MTNTDRPRFGIGLRVLSGVLMAGMFVCVKAVSEDVPLGEIETSKKVILLFLMGSACRITRLFSV
jgi:hypothetical protein